MWFLCNRWVFVRNPDTSKEIVHFVHEVHPVFAVTLSTFLHMLWGLNDEDFPWLRHKGTHTKKKFHTQRSGMWSASLSSLSSVFHTQEGISVIVRVASYVFWHLKRKEILCASKFFHAFTDFFPAKWPWNWKAFQMNSEKVESWHGIIISYK